MRIKLTREEVLIIYEFLKKLNLKFANKECAITIVSDMIKIKPIAQKITQENTDVINALEDDDFKKKTQEYSSIKNEVEEYLRENDKLSKDSELFKKLKKINKEYKPIYDNFMDMATKAILELDQEFDFTLELIKLEDMIELLDKSEMDYNVESISMIYKIIK